jgi:methane/ammonia monooxygenase subunit B
MDLLAGLTIVMLVVGWVRMAVKYPVRLPQQTDRFEPVSLTPDTHVAQIRSSGATFDEHTDTLAINAEVKNISPNPITIKRYVMAMASFVNGAQEELAAAGPAHYVSAMKVDPDGPIAPGETRKVTLTMSGPIFDEERLIPLHDPQQLIAGLVGFTDSQGRNDMVSLKSVLIPTEFQPQYLP